MIKLKGLTQEQLAEALDTYGSFIGRLERDEQNVQFATLQKIADTLYMANRVLKEMFRSGKGNN
ncbi:XRE family transcriptional regulator [Paenibacillus oralis]|uniref:XRE family transcriptional regulator n=1 Tax=Paenibacillus oralis TaxID=2490856 RepID=A0A3P3U925_9BACL|nr:helix-turn-helix transcriptional regulator [Paenibacillus oralis]RRJ66845.1 XRE family transcriptional regulator [Paenibacillus oralis]